MNQNRTSNYHERQWATKVALKARKSYLYRQLKVGAVFAAVVLMSSIGWNTLPQEKPVNQMDGQFVQNQVDGTLYAADPNIQVWDWDVE